MTPMIDIVFLLIIFFMTVSQVSEINKERLELPKLKGSEDQKPALLTINVTEHGDRVVSGQTLTQSELLAVVSNEGDVLIRSGDDPTRLSINIRCDQRAESRTVNKIVEALASMQINKIRITVEVPPQQT